MWNVALDESQAGIKIAGRNINNLRYAYDTTLMAESEKELKSLLMRVKGESEKADLKLSIKKNQDHSMWSHQFMTNRRAKSGGSEDFIFLGSKVTVDSDYNHEIKRHLAPWKKSYDQPRQRIKKQRHHLADKGLYSQS